MKKAIELFDALREEGIISDYAIGGAVGTFFYVEASFTEDTDLFVSLPGMDSGLISIVPVYDRLKELGAEVKGEHLLIGGDLVQMLVPPTALEEEALQEAQIQEVEGRSVKVFRSEYLAAIYLRIQRPKDIGKISELLKSPEFDGEKLQELIARHNLEQQWNKYRKLNT